jgi:hypothetical protein
MNKAAWIRLIIPMCSVTSLCLAAERANAEDLLDFVRSAHRATREAIQFCSCKVEFRGTVDAAGGRPSQMNSCSGRYWYSPDMVRGEVTDPAIGGKAEYVWAESVRLALNHPTAGGLSKISVSRSKASSRYLPRCDAWIQGLLALQVPNTHDFLPFDGLLDRARKVNKVKKTTIDGREVIFVRLTFDDPFKKRVAWDVGVYLDPAVNYLVRRYTMEAPSIGKEGFSLQNDVVEFKECEPGLFFPTKTVGRNGPPNYEYSATISDIVVNKPIPEQMFRLLLPGTMTVTDTVRNVYYQMDQSGRQISPDVPMPAKTIPPPSAAASEEPEVLHETTVEPRSLTSWILPISLAILIAGVAAAVLRRWRELRG